MKSGRRNDCKACTSKYHKERYRSLKEKRTGVLTMPIPIYKIPPLPPTPIKKNVAVVKGGFELSLTCPRCGHKEPMKSILLKNIFNYGR